MDFSNYWWQASEAPAPYGIGNSLRFRGAQQLTGHSGGSGTASVWIKRAKFDAEQTVMSGIAFAADNTLNGSTAVFRDPSAWMHVVVNSGGTYVNGVSVGSGSAISAGTIGNGCELYLASFYFVDGKVLDPTKFGTYDANGVWVPKEYEGDYGANGFYLDFSDPADIGADRSGNGNNLTATGFELADQTSPDWDSMQDSPTQDYSTYNLLSSNGVFSDANLQATGVSSGYTQGGMGTHAATDGKFYWEYKCIAVGTQSFYGITPSYNSQPLNGDLQYKLNARTYRSYDGQVQKGDGGGSLDTKPYGDSWTTGDVIGVALDLENTSLYFSKNGVWQNSGDPTSGAAQTGAAYTDLTDKYVALTAGFPAPTATVNFGQQPFLYTPPAGFKALQTQNLPDAPIQNGGDHFRAITGLGQGADSGQAGAGDWVQYLTTTDPNGFNPSFPATNAFDGDENTYTEFTDFPQGYTFRPAQPIPFTTSLRIKYCGYESSSYTFNDQPYSGNTGNSCIWDEVATGPGELVEFTSKPNGPYAGGGAGGNYLYAIEVDGVILSDLGILPKAQQTFPNGLWWIKDRANSNEHQFVDSVRGGNLALECPTAKGSSYPGEDTAYVAPSGNSVAWCWNAGGPAETNNDGSQTAEVSANVAAGFSIATFSGRNGTATVGHGLSKAPEFIIRKTRNSDSGFPFFVWSKYLPNSDGWLRLNTDQSYATSSLIDGTQPDDQVVTWSGGIGGMDSGVDFVMYCWHSVPGYSTFGSYTGNGDDDGPFIYTGSRPAFVMVKNISNDSSSWMLTDTTRSINNPVDDLLFANNTVSEIVSTSYVVDILSNGFKPKVGDSNLNSSGSNYIYAAFAENPFGGSNVSPVNAR